MRKTGALQIWYTTTHSIVSRLSGASAGDVLKTLPAAQRTKLAEALFNQAYSSLMAIDLFSGGKHLDATLSTLQADPLQAFSIWSACRVSRVGRVGIGFKSWGFD